MGKHQPELVLIEWCDITAHRAVWTSRKKLKPERDPITSVGWLAYHDDESIVLAQTWDDSDGNFHGVNTYPRGCVKRMERLSVDR
jgi:hypothetical protein